MDAERGALLKDRQHALRIDRRSGGIEAQLVGLADQGKHDGQVNGTLPFLAGFGGVPHWIILPILE